MQGLAARLSQRVDRAILRGLAIRPIGRAARAFTRYNEAGGGVVARGLAFAVLFAIVPALLLVAALAGIVISDPAQRARIVEGLAAQFPPLAPLLGDAMDAVLAAAPTVSLISIVILLWSASGMVRALDVAISLIFRERRMPHSPLRVVALVLGAGGAAVVISGLLAAATIPGPLGDVLGVGPGARVAPIAVLVVIVFAAYRFLPLDRPPWRAAILPAVITSLAVAALTGAFAIIGPLVFSSAQFYGAFGVIFLALVWLGFSTDLFLLGAAWTAVRSEDIRGGPDRA